MPVLFLIANWPTPIATSMTPEMIAAIHAEERHGSDEQETDNGSRLVAALLTAKMTGLGVTREGVHELLTERRSHLSSLLRCTAYVFRFIRDLRNAVKARKDSNHQARPVLSVPQALAIAPAIDSRERREALMYWVKHTQLAHFGKEIECCKEGTPLPKNSSILKLAPQVDSDGFLRVGGL